MSWGEPTRDGTPVSRQQTPISQPFSQPQTVLFKPQPTFQPVTQPQQYQQPPQPQYQYPEEEERYDDEDEGWVPPAPQRQSVASHFHPREYDELSPIYIPDNIDSQVEIRTQLLGILPEFRGYKQDDPYNHLYDFLAIANANNPRNTNRNIFRLRLFPFTLKDKAKYWFTSLPSNSITTWDQLKAKFLQEFYPASKTTEIRRVIQDFQQKPGEAFHEAFDRLKELLRSCPHHGIPRWQLVKLFFEGVSETHHAMINASSSGTFMWQDPEEAWQFLEQLSNGSKANFSTRKTVGTAGAVGVDADRRKEVKKEISELNKKFDRLMSTLQNGPQSSSQGGQGGPKTQEANQFYGQGQGQHNNGRPYMPYNQGQQQNFRQNNYQGQSTNQPRTYQPANNSHNGNTNGNGNNNNMGPNNAANNALGTQEEMIAKMYEMFSATQQQSQANAKAIANMERQIGQMAEDQQKRDSGKLPITLEDLFEVGSEVKPEKGEKVPGSEEGKEEGIPVEKGTQPEVDKEVQEEEQSMIAGIKQKKKDKKGKKKPEASKPIGPLINQPLCDELKDAPEDTRILQEMCERNGKSKVPTPDTVRLTVKASEALLGTLPKKEKDPGSPLITTTVGDVVIWNTLLDLGASVNILPGYLYDKYKNEEIEPSKVLLQLADQSTKVSRGKLTNVIVKVGDFFYSVDFLVMEYESLDDAPALILGRPFLATAGAMIAKQGIWTSLLGQGKED
ncbi:hypothetical protein L2E82_23082 [Cichorium intybus]|uniref:Uncharacterized protein n=1 Tax=Cichorium intybus TaxID=13427 RepID=A0ACB9DZV7_CICIN|nr:hypothetical protein L2E82_23082 [Cichorium intybus]